MSQEKKLIRPRARAQTPVPGSRTPTSAPSAMTSAAGGVPEEVLLEHSQRFGLFTAVAAGLWAFGLVMDTLVIPRTIGVTAPRMAIIFELIGVALAVSGYVYVRFTDVACQRQTDLGVWFMLVNAALVAGFNLLATPVID